MKIQRRAATTWELTHKYDDLSWYQWKSRRAARREAAVGLVEELSCRVGRAWKLFSCDGAPCCPNDWLIETSTHEYFVAESWRDLQLTDENTFPGENIILVRWPESHRLLRATVSGLPVPVDDVSMSSIVLVPDHWLRCEVLRAEHIAPELKAIIAAPRLALAADTLPLAAISPSARLFRARHCAAESARSVAASCQDHEPGSW